MKFFEIVLYVFVCFHLLVVLGQEFLDYSGNEISVDNATIGINGCVYNWTIDKTGRNFSSPGYPDNYNNNLDCVWHLHTSVPNSRIEITFNIFSTEMEYDWVTGYENGTRRFELTGTLLSSERWIFNNSKTIVRFYTDISGTDRGFQATVRELRDETATTMSIPTTTFSMTSVPTATKFENVENFTIKDLPITTPSSSMTYLKLQSPIVLFLLVIPAFLTTFFY